MKTLVLKSDAEYDAIIAALRLLAAGLDKPSNDPAAVRPDDGDIGEILTNGGAHEGLSRDQVHDLADWLLGA